METSLQIRVPYLVWRNGRPRWVPSPELRVHGLKGRDLKQPDGSWMDEAAAITAALSINEELGVKMPRHSAAAARFARLEDSQLLDRIQAENMIRRAGPKVPRCRPGEYVYIFSLEGRFAKIGYSTNPRARMCALSAGLPYQLRAEVVAPGRLSDERQLHNTFADYRLKNEWFRIGGTFAIWLAQCPHLSRERPPVRVRGTNVLPHARPVQA